MRKILILSILLAVLGYTFYEYSTRPVRDDFVVKIERSKDTRALKKKDRSPSNKISKKDIPTSKSKEEITISSECFDNIIEMSRVGQEEFEFLLNEENSPIDICEKEIRSKLGIEGKVVRDIFTICHKNEIIDSWDKFESFILQLDKSLSKEELKAEAEDVKSFRQELLVWCKDDYLPVLDEVSIYLLNNLPAFKLIKAEMMKELSGDLTDLKSLKDIEDIKNPEAAMVAQKVVELFLPKVDTAMNYLIISQISNLHREGKLDLNKPLRQNMDLKND